MTSLGGIGGVPKTLPRVGACGDVEEANTALGAAIATDSLAEEFEVLLRNVQNDLLDVHADLSVPKSADEGEGIRVQRHYVERLETAGQQYATATSSQTSAVFGGFSNAAGLLRLARAITRRAERSTWALIASAPEETATLPAVYLNRLADLLLTVASRVELNDAGKVPLGVCGGAAGGIASTAAATWEPGREWAEPRLTRPMFGSAS